MKWKINNENVIVDEDGLVLTDLVKVHNATQKNVLIMSVPVKTKNGNMEVYTRCGYFDDLADKDHFVYRCKRDIKDDGLKIVGNPTMTELIGYLKHKNNE